MLAGYSWRPAAQVSRTAASVARLASTAGSAYLARHRGRKSDTLCVLSVCVGRRRMRPPPLMGECVCEQPPPLENKLSPQPRKVNIPAHPFRMTHKFVRVATALRSHPSLRYSHAVGPNAGGRFRRTACAQQPACSASPWRAPWAQSTTSACVQHHLM